MGENLLPLGQDSASEKLSQSHLLSLRNEFFELIEGGGEVGKLMRFIDWDKTPVGPFEVWPQSLKTALSICLGSKFPMLVWWGRDLTVFYNDAYIPLAGPLKHPMFIGRPAREQWSEIWDDLKPLTEHVFVTGNATWAESMQLFISRKGFLEETYFTFSYSPIRNESGAVGGIINPCQETTERILGERRLKALSDLGALEGKSLFEVGQLATKALGNYIRDVPFSLIYLNNTDGKQATLIGASGVPLNSLLAPENLDLTSECAWPLAGIMQTKKAERVDGLRAVYSSGLPSSPYDEKPDSAYVLPVQQAGLDSPIGFLILGLSPRLAFDSLYLEFLNLVAKHITMHIMNVRTLEDERKRSEALAEIDRSKTAFFSNVSHEFRTPLTLLLGPVEEIINDSKDLLSAKNRERMLVVQRNAKRLQKLVNSLLDFSRLEAGRMQVSYRPVDIARFTTEIASSFETAMEKAGLKYEIHCDKVNEPVFIDTDLWEKMLLNLISNALKFTFDGQISVHISGDHGGVQLQVIDTGIGIPEKELPNIFERFHRVENAKSRTHEGSGIGLALVSEIVKLHGGDVSVESHVESGTTFTVHIPFGSTHLPSEKVIKDEKGGEPNSLHARSFVEESLYWSVEPQASFLIDGATSANLQLNNIPEHKREGRSYRIILADDNADMRDYVRRLLLETPNNWEVLVAANGQEALLLAKAKHPDLILTDVMMPELDGFGLLKEIRNDKILRTTPIIFLSARAGEEALVQGIERGADDYLIKPFSAKELIARVSTQLEMSSMREESALQAQANLAKSQFLANMSHEIRTPLGVILGFAELMLDPKVREDEKRDCLKGIIRNGRQLTGVINEILDLSKIESERLEIENIQFSLTELVEEATTFLNLQAQGKGIGLSVVYDGPVPTKIGSDPSRLRQILLNIVGNAIKFTDHGQVELRIKYLLNKAHLEFKVTDSGIGMTPEQQKNIFQRFVQADNSMTRKYGGTGLGLVVSQKLARALGGDLIIKQSELNHGSTFVFTIHNNILSEHEEVPVGSWQKKDGVSGIDLGKQPHRITDQKRPLDSTQILLVDDSPDNRILVSHILKLAGANVVSAENGEEGVKAAMASNFDIVLMDLQMPVKDGFEATAELRNLSYKKPIIALTAHVMKGDRERCLRSGFDDHVGKPIDRNLLTSAITKLIN